MSQHGRGSGPDNDDPDEESTERERASDSYPRPPMTPRPITPYDPYRSSSSDIVRRATRNLGHDIIEPPDRLSRAADDDLFLPADDPLSAEAWQLELDDVAPIGDIEPALSDFDLEAPPASRRSRRQPSSTRSSRTASSRVTRAPRRRPGAGSERSRPGRPAITIGVPHAVAGSPLAADQIAVALVGINAVSILVMALLLATRLGGLPSPMALQLDAAGNPDFWGPPGVLWRLPVMSLFLTVMFLIVAWFLHPIDRFAARFALGAAFVAQLVAWAAVFQHLG